jgi:catechol 2,3-dioxygenase
MTTTNPAPTATVAIHPATSLGHVQLTVANLERELAFYQEILGFKVHRREGNTAALGAGAADLLRLVERPDAKRAVGTTGLYHFAVLVRRRVDLAQLLRRIAETQTPVQGLVDHHTHLAIYLPDAEGNGIELAWDRPKEQWPSWSQMYRLGNAPLDVEGLFAELPEGEDTWEGVPADTVIGHVHLHVGDLKPAERFYHDILGFDVTAKLGGSAVFTSAGGYHHHIAFNVWAGVGAPPPPTGSLGLQHFTIRVPDAAELERVRERLVAAGVAIEETAHGVLTQDSAKNVVLISALASE